MLYYDVIFHKQRANSIFLTNLFRNRNASFSLYRQLNKSNFNICKTIRSEFYFQTMKTELGSLGKDWKGRLPSMSKVWSWEWTLN